MALGEALKAKTGGIPRWMWGAGLVGAIGIGLYLRSRSSATASTATATPTDTTGTTTASGTDLTGVAGTNPDLSGLATADQIDALQQTLSDLPSEIAIAIGPASGGNGGYTPPANPAPVPLPTPTKPPPGTSWGPGLPKHPAAPAVKPKINKAPGRTPPKKKAPPKPAPKPVKKAHKLVTKLKPKPKPRPAKKPVKKTVHVQNVATANKIAGVVQSSQATHRASSPPPIFLTK